MTPHSFRYRRLLAIAGATFLVAAAAVLLRSSTATHRLNDELVSGSRFADSLEGSLIRSAAARRDTSTVLAALYLERLRLGLGSPFRLVEYVIRDHRLPPTVRRQVALGILARAEQGLAYATPPEALTLLSPDGRSHGAEHKAFIDGVTQRASDPRSAELALRLAYQIAASSGVVSNRAGAVAVDAAAQARDRALVMRDVRALKSRARRDGIDPMDLVPTWRAARRFEVERPLQEPATAAQEIEAVELLPQLLQDLARMSEEPSARRDSAVILDAEAGETASRLAARRHAPPQAPVAVTMGALSSYVMGGARTGASRAARAAFVARSSNEEELAAEYALLRARDGTAPEAAVVMLTAAVALRSYGQERAWHPGDDGPSPLEVQTRLGLSSLSFDPQVPNAWRPYYARMLDVVVRDTRLVFPDLDLSGLNIRFGRSPLRDRALALHDPATRTVFFPLATSAGAMAHELSHDLDWQAARRKYGTSSSYRTDRSVRQYRDGLASTLERLSAAARRDPGGNDAANRPTEAFARGVDWMVASALARRGVLNGYLSAVQDAQITGYASATAPRRDAPQGDPTIVALREITPVAPDAMDWYEETYGDGRHVGIVEGVRRVLTSPVPRWESRASTAYGFAAWSVNARLLRQSNVASAGWVCLLNAPSLRAVDRGALRRAMELAAGARVDGILRRWRDYAVGTPGVSWQLRSLGGAPWSPALGDSLAAEYRDAMLWRAARVDDGRQGVDLAERSERRFVWEECAQGS